MARTPAHPLTHAHDLRHRRTRDPRPVRRLAPTALASAETTTRIDRAYGPEMGRVDLGTSEGPRGASALLKRGSFAIVRQNDAAAAGENGAEHTPATVNNDKLAMIGEWFGDNIHWIMLAAAYTLWVLFR